VKSAQRELLAARERVEKLAADLDATERALATLEERKPMIEDAARRRHVEDVIRPWLESLVGEFVRLLTRAAEISTEIADGVKQVEEGFPLIPTDRSASSPSTASSGQEHGRFTTSRGRNCIRKTRSSSDGSPKCEN
jgi:hypothetical protein